MSNELLGDDFKLFWDSAEDFDSPTWVEIISVGDMGFEPGLEQVEIPIRIPFKVYKKGRADWSLTFTANVNPGNAYYNALLDAVNNGTKIHLAIGEGAMDDDPNYWHAWFFVSGPIDASLDSPGTIDVEGKIHHDRGVGDDELPMFVPAADFT